MTELDKITDKDLLGEIGRRFEEKAASLQEMEFMTKKLLELNEQTKKAEAIKSQFLSLIKNEFNNPISSLLNLSRMLVTKKSPERFDEMVRLQQMELLRLDFQLKNIFSATEIEAGEIANDYVKVDMESVFNDALASFRYLVEEKKLQVSYEPHCEGEIVSDAGKLYMILLNLISNACEFSYPEAKVHVRTRCDDQVFILEVEDFGEGIHLDFKAEIFNRFSKYSTGKTRAHSGLGLGLSVVRAMAEALEGDVDFSTKDGNTVFTVTLPLKNDELTASSGQGSNETFFDDFSDAVEL